MRRCAINGVVILDKAVYQKKVESILDDRTKSSPMNDDPVKTTLKRENKVRSLLSDLNKSGALTDKQYQNLSPAGSSPGILYGLLKIHKPIRPILSAIGTHSYKLANFLVPLLRPLSLGSYLINNSFHSIIILLKSQ